MQSSVQALTSILILSGLLLGLSGIAQAQSDDRKVRRGKFGTSLRELRWDEEKGSAVDRKGRRGDRPTGDTIKLEALLINIEAAVTGAGPRRLGIDDFIISEDGERQQVEIFHRGDDRNLPRSIVLILDYSGSQEPFLRASVDAARRLVESLSPSDRMAVVTDDMELIADFTNDPDQLNRALDSIVTRAYPSGRAGRRGAARRGRSLQFSALFAVLRELIDDEMRRPIIVFQTDGDEAPTLRDQPGSRDFTWNMPRREFGLRDVLTEIARSRATIYTVIPSERLLDLSEQELIERGRRLIENQLQARNELRDGFRNPAPVTEALVRLFTERYARGQEAARTAAAISGGRTVYLEGPEQAGELYRQILSEIDSRYVLGYYSPRTERDGKFRSVKIEIRGCPECTVTAREGYYPPD